MQQRTSNPDVFDMHGLLAYLGTCSYTKLILPGCLVGAFHSCSKNQHLGAYLSGAPYFSSNKGRAKLDFVTSAKGPVLLQYGSV